MARKRINVTKMQIICQATQTIILNGYTNTTLRTIAKELDIRIGLIAFYYPTKEHLLALIVDKLCDFQWKMMEKEADEGISSVLAICLELMCMASAAEGDDIAKDVFVSAYQSPLCLEIIQENDYHRAKAVFSKYNPWWTDDDYRAAETVVSGIEYTILNSNSKSASLEKRISTALDTILKLYNVPEEIRKSKIEKVLHMDYVNIGKRIFKEFQDFIESENRSELKKLL
jgi:hypothetical protein